MILQGKRCIIHGAAGAIGSAVARAYSREGAQLFLAGRTQEKLDALVRELRAKDATLLGRLPTLAQLSAFAAFAASEGAGAMTGAIANLTCGSLTD